MLLRLEHGKVKSHSDALKRWLRRAGATVLVLTAVALMTGAIIVSLAHVRLEPVLSGSMRPAIQPGDLAILRPVSVTHLHVGEVIAYHPPGQTAPVMHRIISINDRGLVTKGDANRTPDPWGRVTTQDTTVEHLVTVVPKVGWLVQVRRQLLITAGGVLLLTLAVWTWCWARRPTNTEAGMKPIPDGQEGSPSPTQLVTQREDNP